MQYYPEVVQVLALDNKHLAVYFSDGHIKGFDVNPLIEKGGVFQPLKDDKIFRNRLTVMNGTAAWDIDGNRDETRCVDIDPFELYKAKDIDDPLSEKTD